MMDNFFKKLVFEDDVLKLKIEDKVVNKVINFYNEAPFRIMKIMMISQQLFLKVITII